MIARFIPTSYPYNYVSKIGSEVDATLISAYLADSIVMHEQNGVTNIRHVADDNEPFK